MSIVRKYNEVTQQWDPVASGDATGVFTDNPLLTAGEVVSVEDVLIRDRNDIETLKKNVSWLAEHGGGGSGGGGSYTEFSVEILDPTNQTTPISEIIWSDNITAMYYHILSKGSGRYTVQVQVDGKTVSTATSVRKDTTITIPRNTLNITKDAMLQIIAYDESETAERATCSIKVAQVNINYCTMQCNLTQLAETNNFLDITYYTSIQGDYTLYWSEQPITVTNGVVNVDTDVYKPIPIPNVVAGNNVYSANIVTELGIPQTASAGQYTRYLLLMKTDNNTVYSASQSAQINIVITTGILVSPLIISSEETPIIIAQNQIYALPFVVYSGSTTTNTYSYRIYKGSGESDPISDLVANNSFGRTISFQINPSVQGLEIDTIIELQIWAYMGAVEDHKSVYFKVTEPSSDFLTAYEAGIQNRLIYKYTFREIQGQSNTILSVNPTYHPSTYTEDVTVNSALNLYNIGTDSGLNAGAYRFRHLAYGIIHTEAPRIFPVDARDTTALIMGASNAYTIELAYSIGNETSDNVVIYKFGDYDPIYNENGHGIIVRAHDYHVAIGGTVFSGDLEDNVFNQLDFTYFGTASGKRYIYVYLNGKMLRAVDAGESSIFDMSSINNSYVAYGGDTSNILNTYANIDVHSICLYEGALNAGQVACSYINNYVSANRLSDNSVDYDLLDTLRNNNGFNKDKDVEEGSPICTIYDITKGSYAWNVTADGAGSITIPEQIQKLPIPKVVLTVGWSYSDFTSGNNLVAQQGCTFQYYDVGASSPIQGLATVEPQGTTSSMYEIKNLNVTYENDLLFSPKPTWFPEGQHTLKADVSDSGHINNAVIGKFINDCFNNPPTGVKLMDIDGVYPTRAIIKNLQANEQLPADLTMKITVEGFPVLLIVRFLNNDNTFDPRILGIYSFNLGRGAYYNQGYIVPKHLYDTNGNQLTNNAVMPGFFGTPPSNDLDTTYTAYCFEGQRSIDCSEEAVPYNSDQYTYAVITSDNGEQYRYPTISNDSGYVRVGTGSRAKDSEGKEIPFDTDHVAKYNVLPDGYFWSPDPTYASNLFSIVYGENSSEALTDFSSLTSYVAAGFNYYKAGHVQEFNTVNDIYYIDSADGDAAVRHKRDGQTFMVTRPQAKEGVPISLTNTAFYYVVAMLFGLVDNFGKNMQFKKWVRRTGTSNTQWTPAFYDLDTALKLSNTGDETISSTVFDHSIINDPDGRVMFVYGKAEQSDDSVITVAANKLFGFDNYTFTDAYTTGFGDQYTEFSIMWNYLRKSYITDIDVLMDTYFNTQLKNCGELVLNYDYTVKYLNTSQVSFLHGDRLGTIRNWLTERITFLDSVFGYKAKDDDALDLSYLANGIYNTPWKNQVHLSHDSGIEKLTLTVNKPLIIRSRIGTTDVYYTYMKKNTPTQVYVTNSVGSPSIQTYFNNSDCIIGIQGLDSLKLTALQAVKIGNVLNANGTTAYEDQFQYGTLSGLQTFDLTNVTTLTNEIDFKTIFNTWDTTALGKEPDPFGLRSVILRNTKSSTTLSVTFDFTSDSHYKNISPFQNIISIDVRNSATTTVSIPDGVSLYSFYISNSNIQTLELDRQPLLTGIDFNGCSRLTTVRLTNMENLSNLSFNSTNVNLSSMTVSGCDNLTSFTVSANGSYTNLPTISIGNCPVLTSINISKWNPTSKTPEPNTAYLNITGTPNLTSLSVTQSKVSKIQCENASVLNTLDLYSSYVTQFGTSTDLSKLDLSACKRNLNLRLSYNPSVEIIDFGSSALVSTTAEAFRNCTKLTTILGNLELRSNSAFRECSKLSGLSAMASLTITGSDGSYTFANTACTPTDVIWAFNNCITGVSQSLSFLFAYCPNIIWGRDATIPANMFNRCGNVTSLAYLFYASGGSNGYYVLKSPTKNGNYFNNDGLFTPLANCTSIYYAFAGRYVVDRYVFANNRTGSDKKLRDIRGFNPAIIVNNANSFNPSSSISYNINDYGNIENMLSYCAPLTSLVDIMNTAFINYDSIADSTVGLSIASSGASIEGCFRASYGTGTFKLDNIFASDSDKQKVYNFCNSFTIANTYSSLKVIFNVDNDTFANFPNLRKIGYISSGNGGTRTTAAYGVNTAFGGNGIVKVIEEFPYQLLSNCPNLTQFTGFFYNTVIGDGTETIELPGNLFNGLSALNDVSYTFFDFKSPYTLTSNGFKDCTNLNNVSYLFAATSFANSRISGQIPYKLFYHGTSNKTVALRGLVSANLNVPITSISGQNALYVETESNTSGDTVTTITTTTTYHGYDIVDENTITVHPTTSASKVQVTVITKDGVEESRTTRNMGNPLSWTPISFQYTASLPNKKIKTVEGCFQYANTEPYSMAGIDIETVTYDTFNPFEYTFNGSTWSHPGKNLILKSNVYGYDGNPTGLSLIELPDEYINYNGTNYQYSYETVDDLRSFNAIPNYADHMWNVATQSSNNYIAAPDLLAYCENSTSTNVNYLFQNSGTVNSVNGWMETTDVFGIKGRLCPYMFKQTSNINSFLNMFENCKLINGVVDTTSGTEGTKWLIPEAFFDYISPSQLALNLEYMFSGIGVPHDTNLDVFNKVVSGKRTLKLAYIFYRWFMFTPTGRTETVSTISSVFNSSRLYVDTIMSAFDLDPYGDHARTGSTAKVRNFTVNFDQVFGDFNKTSSKNDYYVFFGYNTTTSFNNCGPRTDETYQNYIQF